MSEPEQIQHPCSSEFFFFLVRSQCFQRNFSHFLFVLLTCLDFLIKGSRKKNKLRYTSVTGKKTLKGLRLKDQWSLECNFQPPWPIRSRYFVVRKIKWDVLKSLYILFKKLHVRWDNKLKIVWGDGKGSNRPCKQRAKHAALHRGCIVKDKSSAFNNSSASNP